MTINKHYTQRICDDKLIKDLKETFKSMFNGEVGDVRLIADACWQIRAEFLDYNEDFIKSFRLTDYGCQEDFHRESESLNYITNGVQCFRIKRAWLQFLKEHYSEYREDFLNHRKAMAELEIGN